MREGTDPRVRRHARLDEHAVIENRGTVADPGIHDSHATVNLAAGPDRRRTFERDAGMDDRVRSDGHITIDVRCRRIFERHARRHQRRVLFISHDAIDRRQLGAIVDSPDLIRVGRHEGLDAPPVPSEDRDDVGQVVLALRVMRADPANPVEQPLERERVDPGIHLANQPLLGRGVPFLHNTGKLAARFARANDSSVAGRIVGHHGQDSDCSFSCNVML